MSLYVSDNEIPSTDLKELISRSYSTFRASDITPLNVLDETSNLYILELFHGPTFAFKDVALQFLGNLFEYFLVRRNTGKEPNSRYHLTVVGATSGDTGSAAIYGLRGKKDISCFILRNVSILILRTRPITNLIQTLRGKSALSKKHR